MWSEPESIEPMCALEEESPRVCNTKGKFFNHLLWVASLTIELFLVPELISYPGVENSVASVSFDRASEPLQHNPIWNHWNQAARRLRREPPLIFFFPVRKLLLFLSQLPLSPMESQVTIRRSLPCMRAQEAWWNWAFPDAAETWEIGRFKKNIKCTYGMDTWSLSEIKEKERKKKKGGFVITLCWEEFVEICGKTLLVTSLLWNK